jgi:hypothetical protein
MVVRLLAAMALSMLTAATAAAQQPTPLFNAPPSNPAPTQAPGQAPLGTPLPAPLGAPTPLPDQPAPAPLAQQGRVFCDQTVTAQPADPASVPERYRQFVGIFSDADWTPQLCAALVVESVSDDGTATITYAFGPIASGDKVPSGVLHGTGIVKDGALLFQNTDGSQYAFKPFYSDLAGHWTNPKGQSYDAIFKRAF